MRPSSTQQRERQHAVHRSRGAGGKWVKSGSSSRSVQSLAKQSARQDSYIARRRRMCTRLQSSFVREIIVKEGGKVHWIPAATEDGLLFELMDSLFKDTYLDSRRTRLSTVKTMYFDGDSRRSKGMLPRVTVRDANLPHSQTHRIAAFSGWRFPFVIDPYEMGIVKKWLRKHEDMLRVSLEDAVNTCVNTFNRYVKCSKRYLYSGYPLQSSTKNADQSVGSATVVNEGSSTNSNPIPPAPPIPPSGQGEAQNGSDQIETQPTQARFEAFAERMMQAAKDDGLYRALKRALHPPSEMQFTVLCHVWTSTFQDGKPLDEWCTLQQDLFKYCFQIAKRKTGTPEHFKLKQRLSDQFEVLKAVRESAGLPLYERDDWSVQETDSG